MQINIRVRIYFATLVLTVSQFCLAGLDFDVVFNTPGFNGAPSTTIEDKLIELIRHSKTGSKIRGSFYVIRDRFALVKALVMASHRGVDVEMVFDGGTKYRLDEPGNVLHKLIYGGFDGRPDGLRCLSGDCVKFCSGALSIPLSLTGLTKENVLGMGCSGIIVNHNKFFLFSELDTGEKDVIAQTSANITSGQLGHYNDLLILKNDKVFFDGLMGYWENLKKDDTAIFEKAYPNVVSDNGRLKAYFFPRMFLKDPVLSLLKKVSCKLPSSTIQVAQSVFTRTKVAKQMARLRSEGCQIRVITRDDARQFSPDKKVAEYIGDDLIVLPYKGNEVDRQSVNSIHTKIILINASVNGSSEKIPIVITGSHNLDLPSLRTNDEILIEIHNQRLFDLYNNFLDKIIQDAKTAGVKMMRSFYVNPEDGEDRESDKETGSEVNTDS